MLGIDDFLPHVGQVYTAEAGDLRLPLTLALAEPLEGSIREAGGFRLEFAGPPAPMLPQETIRLHREGWADDLFLVALSQDRERCLYEAVFF